MHVKYCLFLGIHRIDSKIKKYHLGLSGCILPRKWQNGIRYGTTVSPGGLFWSQLIAGDYHIKILFIWRECFHRSSPKINSWEINESVRFHRARAAQKHQQYSQEFQLRGTFLVAEQGAFWPSSRFRVAAEEVGQIFYYSISEWK